MEELTNPVFILDSEIKELDSIPAPRLKGDGSAVLMQFQFVGGETLKTTVPTELLLQLINHLANIHTSAKIQEKLPSKMKTFDGEEYGATPQTHMVTTGQVLYVSDEEPLVNLRLQTEEGRQLLIVFEMNDWRRICQTVEAADTPQEFGGPVA